MRRIILQGLILIASFILTWLLLRQINWTTIFDVENNTRKTEEKLGDLFFDIIRKQDRIIDTAFVTEAVDSIVEKICSGNSIDRDRIKLHIVDNDDINAFALPDGHIIVYSGLISGSDSDEELAGVICHEIAHIELGHVMKKLIKELGLSVLFSATTGSSNTEMLKEAAKMLSSTSFDRNLEREADLKAVDYMINSGIDPEPFAGFLFRLTSGPGNDFSYPAWISTHPDAEERSRYIIDYAENAADDKTFQSVVNGQTWEKIKAFFP